MKPIREYELVNEAGEFKRLPAGIYGVKITNVVDVPDREYLEIYCDITEGEYANYFKSLVASGFKDSSKTTRSYKMSALPFFKSFITAVERTNTGYHWNWDEKSLIGKNVMAIFGEEEYKDSEGNIKIATKVVEFRSLEAYQKGILKAPELKKLASNDTPVVNDTQVLYDDDLPF